MTTKDDNIAPYLLDPKDPGYKKPKATPVSDETFIDVKVKKNKQKRQSLIKTYFGYMVEVILT